MMEAMGVDEAAARGALQASGWSVPAACQRLLGETPPGSARSRGTPTPPPSAGRAGGASPSGGSMGPDQREKISDVMSMGFTEEQALSALLDCEWNVAQAVDKLTGTPR